MIGLKINFAIVSKIFIYSGAIRQIKPSFCPQHAGHIVQSQQLTFQYHLECYRNVSSIYPNRFRFHL